jgi:monofunctional biosynthetic peptidoglycan transglycosylase
MRWAIRSWIPKWRWRRTAFTAWAWRIGIAVLILLIPAPIVVLLLLRFVPVPGTPQMLLSAVTGNGAHYQWAGDDIAPVLGHAAIAGEDDKFCSHHGFDFSSIDKAVQAHERGKRLRGASTISQQAARSLFLLPVRSWVRKGVEAWLTVLMEALWPKTRILTVYLNVVDWGHGNFGAEAASQAYFHRSAATLTAVEAARLASILPDPDNWRATRPGPYVAARTGILLRRMAEIRRDRLDFCLHP